MAIGPGTQLAHYEVSSLLGKGGMGEVWRARDARLDRDVALKFLPPEFAADAERLARFEREARVLAALDHPNVASIFGVENIDGHRFLVMQLVEGDELSQRIMQGALPVDEAIDIAMQIAGALEAAHEKGIIHRDLKPANVKVDSEGQVRVLDFGLAKALEEEQENPDSSMSPTITHAATQAGVILGTAAYMSPEQARGKHVDRRADIWAFGVLLWEMLIGQQVFAGETVTDTLAAVLTREMDLSNLPLDTPPQLRWVLQRCLVRDSRQRLRDIGDARLELEAITRGDDSANAVSSAETARPDSRIWKATAALASLVAIVALGTMLVPTASDPPAHSGSRFALQIPPSDTYTVLQNSALALSPDGQILAYAAKPASSPAVSEIYLQRFDSFDPESVPNTLRGYAPFFSPDGEWLGYFKDTGMWKKSIRGGPATKLAAVAGTARGGSWTDDNRIFFAPTWFSPIFQVSADGGEPTEVTTLLDGEKSHRFPSALPDGSAVIFTVGRADTDVFDDASIAIQSLVSGKRSVLVDGGSFGVFLSPDRLLYGRQGRLFVARLDVENLQLIGSPAPVIDDMLTSPTFGSSQFGVSASGTLAYLTGSPDLFNSRAVEVSRVGEITDLPLAPQRYSMIEPSPDGKHLAVRIDGANGQIWVYDVERGTLSRITREWDADYPTWYPDGEWLAYVLSKGESSEIARMRIDGTGEPEILWSDGSNVNSLHFAPDGQSLVFTDVGPDTRDDLWVLDLDGKPAARPYLQTAAREADAVISPDGNWIAYTSDQSGRDEIYVQAYPVPDRRWQISAQGGTAAVWSPADGDLLFKNGNEILAVAVELGDRFSAGLPRSLFKLPSMAHGGDARKFSVSRDGRYLAVLPPEGWHPTGRLHLILDWTSTLPDL